MSYWTPRSVVWGKTFLNSIVTALTVNPAAALIVTPKVRLSKDPAFAPDSSSTRAGLAANEADYDGYAAGGVAPVLSGAVNLAELVQGSIASVLFLGAGGAPFTGNTIFGWWMDDGADVIVAEAFPAGQEVPIASAGDFLDLEVVLPFPLLSDVPQ